MNASSITIPKSMTAHVQRVGTLEFSDLRAGDIILIRTKNSLYSFLIANARTLCGRLLGDVNDDQSREAVLVGGVIRRAGRSHTLTSRLVTESRALFALQSGSEVMGLTTSPVVSLCYVRLIED